MLVCVSVNSINYMFLRPQYTVLYNLYNLYFPFATRRLNYIHSFWHTSTDTYIYYTISYTGTIYIQFFHIPAHGYIPITISGPWGLSQPGCSFCANGFALREWGKLSPNIYNLSNCACLRHQEPIPGRTRGSPAS